MWTVTGCSLLPEKMTASYPARLSESPKSPPQLEDVTMFVSGEIVEMLKREVLGQPQPVSGPVETTSQLSASKARISGVIWCSRISAAMIFPPRVRSLSLSVHGNSRQVCSVRSTKSTLPMYPQYSVKLIPP